MKRERRQRDIGGEQDIDRDTFRTRDEGRERERREGGGRKTELDREREKTQNVDFHHHHITIYNEICHTHIYINLPFTKVSACIRFPLKINESFCIWFAFSITFKYNNS